MGFDCQIQVFPLLIEIALFLGMAGEEVISLGRNALIDAALVLIYYKPFVGRGLALEFIAINGQQFCRSLVFSTIVESQRGERLTRVSRSVV